MKTFITNEEFNQVLELLGLPGETLSIEITGRDRWPFPGVNSSWAMRAVIGTRTPHDGHEQLAAFEERVVYVPVLLHSDTPPTRGLTGG